VQTSSAWQAVSLLRGTRAVGRTVLTAANVVITADARLIPAGIDGEAVAMPTPVLCSIRSCCCAL
jgi:hypothetical protein